VDFLAIQSSPNWKADRQFQPDPERAEARFRKLVPRFALSSRDIPPLQAPSRLATSRFSDYSPNYSVQNPTVHPRKGDFVLPFDLSYNGPVGRFGGAAPPRRGKKPGDRADYETSKLSPESALALDYFYCAAPMRRSNF